MIHLTFSIYDFKALVYSPPFYAATVGLAIRIFRDAASDPNTQLYKHPTDFILYQIGEFDDQDATLVPCQLKEVYKAIEAKTDDAPKPEPHLSTRPRAVQ